MKINSTSQETTFKQIKLTSAELKNGSNKFKQILREPFVPNLKYELLELLEPHLNKEVDLKNFANQCTRKDFSVYLYLKFFKTLENNNTNNCNFENIIEELNISSENYIPREVTKDNPIYDGYNITKVNNLVEVLHNYLGISKECFLEKARRLPVLQYLTEISLPPKLNYISKNLGINTDDYIGYFLSNPKALILPGHVIVETANETMATLDVNLEDFRKLVTISPKLLTVNNLPTHIKDVAEFLETDEEKVKKLITENPKLATTSLDNIKTNFYAMKEYLNVNREKMLELSLLAARLIVDKPKFNQHNIEKICESLDILPTTYIKTANNSPTMYLKGPLKLKKLIDYLSDKLGYTDTEAKEFIAQNLNLLSYRLANIIEKTETNEQILNEELNIENKTYINLLKKNSHLMGCKNELIKQNINDMCDYLKIDKMTYSNMVIKAPLIITMYPEDININITGSAKLLNISKEEYKELCIKEPSLLRRMEKHLYFDITHNSSLIGLTEKEYIELGLKNTKLLAKRFDSLDEIYAIL